MCKTEKPTSEFHKNRANPDGLGNRCKPCCLEYNRKRYQSRPDVRQKISDRGKRDALKNKIRKYNLSVERYNQMVTEQDGRCAICNSIGALYIDHCHDTLIVRGLLCLQCNTALGNFRDNPYLLQKAIEYLNK